MNAIQLQVMLLEAQQRSRKILDAWTEAMQPQGVPNAPNSESQLPNQVNGQRIDSAGPNDIPEGNVY